MEAELAARETEGRARIEAEAWERRQQLERALKDAAEKACVRILQSILGCLVCATLLRCESGTIRTLLD